MLLEAVESGCVIYLAFEIAFTLERSRFEIDSKSIRPNRFSERSHTGS